jgi:hypothetical protein
MLRRLASTPLSLARRGWNYWRAFGDRRAAQRAIAKFPAINAATHRLPGELIVSLTSYPARFPTLPFTLKSLLDQTVAANRTILWIAHNDMPRLMQDILELQDHGLEILACDDVRSYKKIIPALERWPGAFVVTADDDVYYTSDWLECLTSGFNSADPAIICRRAHRPARNPDRTMRPYHDWSWEVENKPGAEIFPTGVGGVLYPPGSLSAETTDRALFSALAPNADDLWLYWMGRRAGASYRQVGPYFKQINWAGTQRTSLFGENQVGGNDSQIRALEAHFGPA